MANASAPQHLLLAETKAYAKAMGVINRPNMFQMDMKTAHMLQWSTRRAEQLALLADHFEHLQAESSRFMKKAQMRPKL